MEWIIYHIGKQIDWGQYGGQSGMSVAHYLIELVTFIHYNQDLRDQHAVISSMVDFHKHLTSKTMQLFLQFLQT